MSRARQAAHGMLQNRVSERGGRTEGTAQSTARLQRQSEGGPRARVCKDRAKEDREGPAPSTVCLQRQTQRERERNRAQPGPHRAMAGRERKGAGGSAWFSNHAQTLPRKRARETERDREGEGERECVGVSVRASERESEGGRTEGPASPAHTARSHHFL